MDWISIKSKKPQLKQQVLIYCQGYDVTGKHHWSHFELAIYDVNYNDKRKFAFYQTIEYENRAREDGSTMSRIWQYKGITHWMPLPDKPPKIEFHEVK